MGIFFDQDWFDARLKAAGLTRGSMAQAAGHDHGRGRDGVLRPTGT
jgi:hypothetical protein